MIRLFLNGLGASAGAGLTYLYNVVPRLSAHSGVHTTLAVQPQLRDGFRGLPAVEIVDASVPTGTFRRFWFEQKQLPRLIRDSEGDVLLSAGNFSLRHSPVPQILLSGNSLYTSGDFYRDLRRRGEYRLWLDTKCRALLARKSVHWADRTVAPSEAFARDLTRWTGRHADAIHHGFDAAIFFADSSPLPVEISNQLTEASDCLKLLFVSHYNYYRNFETLFRAVARLRDLGPKRKVRLFLTCTLEDLKTPGAYKTESAVREIRTLGIRNEVIELGSVPYRQLHQLYRACDVYLTAAYAETFAHPLVEAMASGLPVLASDIPAHREVCGNFAEYFPAFSPEILAQKLSDWSGGLQPAPQSAVLQRFSWARHLQEILGIAEQLTSSGVQTLSAVTRVGLRSA